MSEMKGSSTTAENHALQKELDDASCPICMDHPHNAVLIICSSHEKGCRSYICDTSYRHSNCLDRFKKLKANSGDSATQPSSSVLERSYSEIGRRAPHILTSEPFLEERRLRGTLVESHEIHGLDETMEEDNNSQEASRLIEVQSVQNNLEQSGGCGTVEANCLKCPLCRGIVLGWMIVKEARQYLDQKLRNCARESCSFSGNYGELRRHARRVHPSTRPGDVDPSRQSTWRRLENQHEYGDILSAIRSAMPGAVVLGDYVIDTAGEGMSHESNVSGEGGGPWWTSFFLFHMMSSPIRSLDVPRGSSRTGRMYRRSSAHRNLWGDNLLGLQDDDANIDDDMPMPRRRRRFMRSRPNEEQL